MVLMGLVLMRQILFTEDFEMRRKKSIIGIITEWIVFAVLAFMVLKCLNPFFFQSLPMSVLHGRRQVRLTAFIK